MKAISYKKILAATDYTPLSENAVATASSICQKQNATLILFHVVESAVLLDEHHFELDYSTELKNAERSHLRKLADEIRKKYNIKVDEVISYGNVISELLHVVQDKKPDMVLIGTHGTSGFRRLFIGSTAYRVIRHTTIPVMTIPGEGDWTNFQHILFPIRVVPNALGSYIVIRPIIKKNNATLFVFGLALDTENDKLKDVFKLESRLEKKLLKDEVAFELAYDQCHNYAECILSAAEMQKTDLIVVTATLDFTIREFFIGPFAQQIINHAKVPVLFIRSQ